jgi:Arc/MetJ-type ribon-helix-helix transcriptional regulator
LSGLQPTNGQEQIAQTEVRVYHMLLGRNVAMKQLQIELPDKIAGEVAALVQAGWFHSQDELVRTALLEFLRHRRLELTEAFQREDIDWALHQRTANP